MPTDSISLFHEYPPTQTPWILGDTMYKYENIAYDQRVKKSKKYVFLSQGFVCITFLVTLILSYIFQKPISALAATIVIPSIVAFNLVESLIVLLLEIRAKKKEKEWLLIQEKTTTTPQEIVSFFETRGNEANASLIIEYLSEDSFIAFIAYLQQKKYSINTSPLVNILPFLKDYIVKDKERGERLELSTKKKYLNDIYSVIKASSPSGLEGTLNYLISCPRKDQNEEERYATIMQEALIEKLIFELSTPRIKHNFDPNLRKYEIATDEIKNYLILYKKKKPDSWEGIKERLSKHPQKHIKTLIAGFYERIERRAEKADQKAAVKIATSPHFLTQQSAIQEV